jgi:hypothetical protein
MGPMENIPIGGDQGATAPDNVVPIGPPDPEPRTSPAPAQEAVTGPAVESIPLGTHTQDAPADPSDRGPAPVAEPEPVPEPEDLVEQEEEEEVLSWDEVMAREADAPPEEDEVAPRPNAELIGMAKEAVRVGLGLTVAAANAAADGVRAAKPEETLEADASEPLSTLIGAGLGLLTQVGDLTMKALDAASEAVEPAASWIAHPPFMRSAAETAAGAVRLMNGRWQMEEAETQRAAEAFVGRLVPEITKTLLEHLDLDLILERLPVEDLVDRVDVDRIVSRVDLDAAVSRVDLDAVVGRIDVNEIAARIDLDAVAAGIDVNAVVSRVDMDAIIERIDVTEIVEDVIDEVDLPGIIRTSSDRMAGETVQELRLRSMDGDAFVQRIVDRILRRRPSDAPDPPGSAPPSGDAGGTGD